MRARKRRKKEKKNDDEDTDEFELRLYNQGRVKAEPEDAELGIRLDLI